VTTFFRGSTLSSGHGTRGPLHPGRGGNASRIDTDRKCRPPLGLPTWPISSLPPSSPWYTVGSQGQSHEVLSLEGEEEEEEGEEGEEGEEEEEEEEGEEEEGLFISKND
jgi:hypothetical protein